ncbi:MAG: XdhC family protein [Candidatus Ventricola sp.]
MKDVFAALLEQMRAGHDAMLATLVAHEGSVPRSVGAQMVLTRDGLAAGTVGGGLREKEMTRFGLSLLEGGRSGLHVCGPEGERGEAPGAACSGQIAVFFQYIAADDPRWTALAEALLRRIGQRRGGWLVLRLDGGAPALLDEDRLPVCGEAPADAAALCRPFAWREGNALVMPLAVGERAVIFGAGHCAQALAPLLASVGFCVTVYDDRPELAAVALFPQAERVICAPFDRIGERMALTQEDYILAMASTHDADLCVLRQVMQAEHAYTGMLGGGHKRAFIAGKLLEEGVPQARIDRLHTPVGLSIGAVTPAEIAVSIAAEMVMVRAENRKGTSA